MSQTKIVTGRSLKTGKVVSKKKYVDGYDFNDMLQYCVPVIKSLNTTGKLFRARQIEHECKRLRKGAFELFTPEQVDELLNRPITTQERLRNYRGNGRYLNGKIPQIKLR